MAMELMVSEKQDATDLPLVLLAQALRRQACASNHRGSIHLDKLCFRRSMVRDKKGQLIRTSLGCIAGALGEPVNDPV